MPAIKSVLCWASLYSILCVCD